MYAHLHILVPLIQTILRLTQRIPKEDRKGSERIGYLIKNSINQILILADSNRIEQLQGETYRTSDKTGIDQSRITRGENNLHEVLATSKR